MLAASEFGFITEPEKIKGEFEDFIGIYPKFVHPELCAAAINMFENILKVNPKAGQYGKNQMPEKKLNRHDVAFMLDDLEVTLASHMYQYINTAFENYREEFNQIKRINLQNIGIKIQKTPPGGGYHHWHYENSSFKAANRELAWMIYLNDLPDGEGETEFLFQKKRYKPEIGTLLIWPAGMTHVHRGNTVFTHDKYIATGWFLKLP